MSHSSRTNSSNRIRTITGQIRGQILEWPVVASVTMPLTPSPSSHATCILRMTPQRRDNRQYKFRLFKEESVYTYFLDHYRRQFRTDLRNPSDIRHAICVLSGNLIKCLDTFCQRVPRQEVADYAIRYRRVAPVNCYQDFVTRLTCQCIIHTEILTDHTYYRLRAMLDQP